MPTITILPSGATAEVPEGTKLLDAGEAAGVELEAGCFNCSCGTCVAEVVAGMEAENTNMLLQYLHQAATTVPDS